MAVPKKRTSKSSQGMRRSHLHLTFTGAIESCPTCGELKKRHFECQACGYWHGNAKKDTAAAPASE